MSYKFDKIHLKNYKCFDEDGITIDHLESINVIIGKNNSGKSSIIELFKFLVEKNGSFFSIKRKGHKAEIICEHLITESNFLERSFPVLRTDKSVISGKSFLGATVKYSTFDDLKKSFISVDREHLKSSINHFDGYLTFIKSPFSDCSFSHLNAERDIQPELSNNVPEISINGSGSTNLIQQIINSNIYDSSLVEDKLLTELNKIVTPEIEFSRILVQKDEHNVWEVYFESISDGRIPLSKMGSGIKTILLVLILLNIMPEVKKLAMPGVNNLELENYIFAFEELENNLHPAMQRRLYYYLHEFALKNKCIFLLTTHSNIVIDLYSSLSQTQIFHVTKTNNKSSIKSTLSPLEYKMIFDDLDVRASDILQSNGIIWVEGPSDRIYLNKWISLLDSSLVEGYHYSIMFYGGKLLSNLSFNYDILEKELIPMLKLNSNAHVIIDRDGKTISPKLSKTKERIQSEIGEKNTWITKGREIENYLSNETIGKWLSSIYKINQTFNNEVNTKLEDNISRIKEAAKIQYNLNKNKYAMEIVDHIEKADIENTLDLAANLKLLISHIKKWNRLP